MMATPTPNAASQVSIIAEMLAQRRPMGSLTEKWWRDEWILDIPNTFVDEWDNIHLFIPRQNGQLSNVLWSSHTDTVHKKQGYQELVVSPVCICLHPDEDESNCLGADDTIGCWIMRELALARVPGHYIWHYGEEQGLQGSSELAMLMPSLLHDIKYAIALDRQGYTDVVSHQMGERSAGPRFIASMVKQLKPLGKWRSHHGVYTDTASYVDSIPHCTNLSVGYFNQHTRYEWCNPMFAIRLANHLINHFNEDLLENDDFQQLKFRELSTTSRIVRSVHAVDAMEEYHRPVFINPNVNGNVK